MPKLARIALGVATLLLFAVPAEAQVAKAESKKSSLVGTWERTNFPGKEYRQLKTYSDDSHFVWVIYIVADGEVAGAGGGTYTFDGTALQEKYLYGSGNIKTFIKQPPPSFSVKFEGEGWVQEGKAPNGAMLHETYRRAK